MVVVFFALVLYLSSLSLSSPYCNTLLLSATDPLSASTSQLEAPLGSRLNLDIQLGELVM